jgi:hypothetical protein
MNQHELAIAIIENRIEDADKSTSKARLVSAEDLRTVLLALRASPPEAEGVSVPRTVYDAALNYIRHVGANHVMRGEPHPQQWIVDGLERCGRSPHEGEKP